MHSKSEIPIYCLVPSNRVPPVSNKMGADKRVSATKSLLLESFNVWGGRGYDDFVPGEGTKKAPSGHRTK